MLELLLEVFPMHDENLTMFEADLAAALCGVGFEQHASIFACLVGVDRHSPHAGLVNEKILLVVCVPPFRDASLSRL